MIRIVMKPTPDTGIVDREKLYTAFFNDTDFGLRIRGRNAPHAEAKLLTVFKEQLRGGRLISFNLEAFLRAKQQKED